VIAAGPNAFATLKQKLLAILTLISRKQYEYNCNLLGKHHGYAQEGIFGVVKQASELGVEMNQPGHMVG